MYYSDDQTTDSEMGMVCRMHRRQTTYTQNFGCKNLRKRPLEKAKFRCFRRLVIPTGIISLILTAFCCHHFQ
jgi:hypothetical protein